MKSTGEVMGIAADFPTAFGKAQAAAGVSLPTEGAVFITVTDTDKPAATQLAARFHDLGFEVIATGGTAQAISRDGRAGDARSTSSARARRNVVDLIRERRCDLVINTPTGSGARADGYEIRTAAVRHGIPCVTTMTGASAAARAIAAQGERRGRGALPAGDPRDRRRPPQASMTAHRWGRRLCEVTENRASGGYRVFSLLDAEGPSREPGQFYMLAAERHWEERGGRPFLPRALSVADAEPEAAASGSTSCSRRSGRAPSGSARSSRASGSGSPARSATPSPSRASWRPGAAGAILVGGGIGIAPLALLRRRFADRGVPARVLLGFRDRGALAAASTTSSPAARSASPARTATLGHRGYVTDLLAAMLDGRRRGQRRRLRLRPAGDAGGGAGDVRGARRRLRAGAGVADGLRLRRLLRLRRAARRGRLHAPLRRRPGRRAATGSPEVERMPELCGIELRAPGDQRLGHLRRDRRPPRLRRRAARGLPLRRPSSRRRSRPSPRAGNEPQRIWETPAGMINSIGLPNKGLEGFLAEDLPQLAELPVPLIVSVMATEPRGVRAAGRRRSASATRSPRSSSTSPARTSTPGLIVGEQPAETAALLEALRPLTDEAADREADARTSPTRRRSRSPPRRAGPTRSR